MNCIRGIYVFNSYGAQHPIVVLSGRSGAPEKDYVVVGHCCESGDLFSCAPGEPETLQTRKLSEAQIGDLLTIEGAGAYCAGMSTKNYNSFPEAAEVILDTAGKAHLIRRLVRMENGRVMRPALRRARLVFMQFASKSISLSNC
jgi:diaminopimelate decarboxylase